MPVMRSLHTPVLVLLASNAAALAPAADPAAEPPGYKLEAFRWSGELAAGMRVQASNGHGDLHVRESADGTLLVSAMIQKIGSDADEFDVRIERGADALAVQVVPRVPAPQGRVDVTLMVPDRHAVELETDAGDIQVGEFDGAVRAHSRGGNISAMRVRSLAAQADAGSIAVALRGKRFRAPIELECAADIDVTVSADASLDVDARGREVEIALPADHVHDVIEAPGRYRGTLGAGGVALRATSRAGSVRVGPLM
jgi:hypothetical protein